MSLDKFGHHENSLIRESMRGPRGEGYKLTEEGDYDVQNKLIRNVGSPKEQTDAATKMYVDSVTPSQESTHWNFFSKRLSNIGDAYYEGEAINIRTLKQLTMTFDPTDSSYNGQNYRISNIASGINGSDAVNLKDVQTMCAELSEKHERILKRFGSKMLHYIHKVMQCSPYARTNIMENENNFINWDELFQSLHSNENLEEERIDDKL